MVLGNILTCDAEDDFEVGNAYVPHDLREPNDLREESCGVLIFVCVSVLNTQDFMFCNCSQLLPTCAYM